MATVSVVSCTRGDAFGDDTEDEVGGTRDGGPEGEDSSAAEDDITDEDAEDDLLRVELAGKGIVTPGEDEIDVGLNPGLGGGVAMRSGLEVDTFDRWASNR